ncbi:MAG: hypothetical protein HYR66_13240 [Sphingobacteriales bacterium]|nr:hypothetical protein [Sphingobacteriales bacterium]MBI3717221.1 hypothetical protein [Sphingobacteriales bacterium]
MNYNWKVLLPLFLGTVIMIFVLQKQGSDLKTENTPLKIVSFEFAKTKEEAQTVLDAWKPDANINRLTIARKNIYLDFIFIFFYSLFLFAACRKIRYHSQRWQKKAGKNFAYMGLAAGGFDIIENILMLRTLDGNYDVFTTLATFVCAAIKFALAGFAILYILLGLPRLFRSRKY